MMKGMLSLITHISQIIYYLSILILYLIDYLPHFASIGEQLTIHTNPHGSGLRDVRSDRLEVLS